MNEGNRQEVGKAGAQQESHQSFEHSNSRMDGKARGIVLSRIPYLVRRGQDDRIELEQEIGQLPD